MRCAGRRLDGGGQAPVAQQHDEAERGVADERPAQRRRRRGPEPLADPLGHAGAQRADGGDERADQRVAGEQRGAHLVRPGPGQQRLLGRQEHADVAGRRVHRADEGDDDQRPEVGERGEAEPGGDHQERDVLEQATAPDAMAAQADEERQRGRAEQRRRDDDADAGVRQPQRRQVRRQDDADDPVAERPDPPRLEQHGRVATGAGRQEPHPGIIPHPTRSAPWARGSVRRNVAPPIVVEGDERAAGRQGDGAGDRQAEAAATIVERTGLVEAGERLEDALAHLGRDRLAVVGDGELGVRPATSSVDRDRRRGVALGVVEQVADDPRQAGAVDGDGRAGRRR